MALLSAFNPHELPEGRLRAVATGREEALGKIIAAVRRNLGAASVQHLIVTAPRGFGKSFLMRHAQFEIERIAREDNLPLIVALMPEEMPHVGDPETLLSEIARTFEDRPGSEAELSWHEDEGPAWDAAAAALERAIAGKLGPEGGLAIALVENFDRLLRAAFGKSAQSARLRRLLTRPGNRLMLVTASASGAFDRDYDKPLFQAFAEIRLQPWTLDECVAFFDRQRIAAGKPPLDDEARARAKAVATFIGGTPRLATLIGEALLDDDVLAAAGLLQKLVDELTPYYKQRIEDLPRRARKLLDALVRGGEPATQSELARRVNAKSQAAIAGPFGDMVAEDMVTGIRAPGGSEIFYRLGDRVFAHYYRRRVAEHGVAVSPLAALVDLLVAFYTPEQKKAKAADFARRGEIGAARLMARLYDADMGGGRYDRHRHLRYLVRIAIPQQLAPLADAATATVLHMIAAAAEAGNVDAAYARVEAGMKTAATNADRTLLLLARCKLDAYEGIANGDAAAREAKDLALGCGATRIAGMASSYLAWSNFMNGAFKDCMTEALATEELASRAHDLSIQARALRFVAWSLAMLKGYEEALGPARMSAEFAEQAGNVIEHSLALHLAAYSLLQLGRNDEALATARQAAVSAEQAGEEAIRSNALLLIATSLLQLGRNDVALVKAREAEESAIQVEDVGVRAMALSVAAQALSSLGRHEEAVTTLVESCHLAGHIEGDLKDRADWSVHFAARSAAPMAVLSLDDFHALLAAAAKALTAYPDQSAIVKSWLYALAAIMVSKLPDADALAARATAIDLHFPSEFPAAIGLLRHASTWLAGGRDAADLARMEPDLARTLAAIHPPAETNRPRKVKRGK